MGDAPESHCAPARRKWHALFLEHYAKTLNMAGACRAASVSRAVAYAHRAKYPVFRRKWAEAEEAAIDELEAAAHRRALAERDRGSHILLIFLLKAHRRDKYGDAVPAAPPAVEHTGSALTAKVLAKLSNDELNALASIARKVREDP